MASDLREPLLSASTHFPPGDVPDGLVTVDIREDLERLRETLKDCIRRETGLDIDAFGGLNSDLCYVSPDHPWMVYELVEQLEIDPTRNVASMFCAIACLDKLLLLASFNHGMVLQAIYSATRLGTLVGMVDREISDSLVERSSRVFVALNRGTQVRQESAQQKKQAAVEELQRRLTNNSKLTKTSAIKAMAEDGRWGKERTLKGYCKDIKTPGRKRGGAASR
jgi:hypothetical protein